MYKYMINLWYRSKNEVLWLAMLTNDCFIIFLLDSVMSDSDESQHYSDCGSEDGFQIMEVGSFNSPAAVKSKGGRREDSAWQNFTEVANLVYKCKFCSNNVVFQKQRKVDKIKVHMKNCKKVLSPESLSSVTAGANTPCSINPSVLGKRPSTMDEFGIRLMNKLENVAFEEAIAVFVYSSGLPLSKLSHPAFLEALQILRPDVKIPDRNKLSNELLDRAYEKVAGKLQATLNEGGYICMTSDAWTSVLGLSVINFIAVTRKGTYFAGCKHAKSISHSAMNMFAILEAEVLKLGGFDKVAGLCTDNTSTNKKMWRMFDAKYPLFFSFGCICHGLHLLVKDFAVHVPWLATLSENAKKVVKMFKHSQGLWSDLCEKQLEANLRMLAMPGATRWGSFQKCFRSVS